MIYEIQLRAAGFKQTSSDHLIWIESALPTRAFERWMEQRNLLTSSTTGIVVRWSIIQTRLPAHFNLAMEEPALLQRIAALNNPALAIKKTSATVKEQRRLVLNGLAFAA